jgi:amino acid adenylation domain-containing protein
MRICEFMRRGLESLVEALERAPNAAVGTLEVIPEAEQEWLLHEWNETKTEFPGDKCIHQLFEEQVDKTPDRTAVVSDKSSLSYGELNRRANQLARYLRELGVGPDRCVALYIERGTEMIVGLLGTMKAGGVYVPIAPTNPIERVRLMLQDCDPLAVLTQGNTERLTNEAIDLPAVIDLSEEAPVWRSLPETNLEADVGGVTPDHLAYIIYTSGSTGRPKGVMIEHQGLSNLTFAQIQSLTVGPDSRVLQYASYSFDASVFEITMALCRGAALVLPTRGATLVGEALLDAVNENGISHATLPPAVLAALPWSAGLDSIRELVVAGEAMTGEIVRCWSPGRRLINAYGPTEVTVWATMHECRGDEPEAPPIGRPISNTQVYILDTNGWPAPVGVIGELYIGGGGVGRGYLRRPELTAERFQPDPFGREPGARVYKTGDLGRWLPDGKVEFLGRNDFQVKIRGFRIELGEIEAALREFPEVGQAVVIARDGEGEKRLAGYVVPAAGGSIDSTAVRKQLAQRLPDYMVPAAIVELNALPLTPNGKLDRKALPEPELISSSEWRAARSPKEEILCTLFADVLGMERVGIDDNFFELGGHSLLATRLVSRIRATLGVELAIRTLFESPSVAGLTPRLKETTTARPPLVSRQRPERLPLSYAQQRLWFLDRLKGTSTEYNIPGALRLRGELDLEALKRAINTIVARHESLRTRFDEIDGVPVQVVEEELRIEVELEDLSRFDGIEQQEWVMAVLLQEGVEPFDLRLGPLLRMKLLKLGEEDHILLRTMHHIVSDGWSEGVFNRELTMLYEAISEGRENPLRPPVVQYADYAIWQREWLERGGLAAGLEYWKEQLAGIPERLELPTDRARPAVQTYGAEVCQVRLSGEQAAGLKRVSRSQGATLYMTMLATFGVLLGRYSGQEEIVVGTPVANRQEGELEEMIGFFVNTLAMRMRVRDEKRLEELLGEVRRVALEAYEHQEVPFERVVEELRPERSLNTTPIFQVVFALQNAPLAGKRVKGLELEPVMGEELRVRFDLEVHAWESEGEMVVAWLYNRDLFDRWRMEQMGRHYVRVLEATIGDVGQKIGRIDLLGEEERRQILVEWNQTWRELPQATLTELFEEQVRRTPAAVAVIYQEQTLTYRQLNERANRLAHLLIGERIGPEDVVALALPRSFEMIVALLGILKAGAAYLPIDLDYPPQRVAFMLEDAASACLITTSQMAARLPQSLRHFILDDPEMIQELVGRPEHNPENRERIRPLSTHNQAYIMYTSGSTGTPKGVIVTQRAVVRLVCNQAYARLDDGQAILQLAPIAFDASTFEIWGCLLHGGRLVLFPGIVPALEDLGEILRKQEITTMFLTTALFHAMVDSRLEDLVGIQQLLTGGEMVRPPELMRVLERIPECQLIHVYGPTETTTFSSYKKLRPIDCIGERAPIGEPIGNTEVYVLGGDLQPAPVGVAGELYIGGEGLARGYLKRPALTAERFVANPYGEPGKRMYRTGDLVRWRADGNLEFLGRVDGQVKIRGFRIELGEIEARLRERDGVREAVVTVRESAAGEKRLTAYYTWDEGSGERLQAETLRSHLASKLPEYMVPAMYVRLDRIPLTPNGKVDRKALPEPDAEAYVSREYEAPEGETETMLAEIWSELLEVERVGRNDNFFELGGHSLLATRVIARIRERFGIGVPIHDLFGRPQLKSFAACLALPQPQGIDHAVPVRAQGKERALFFAHEGADDISYVWSLAPHIDPNIPIYALPVQLSGGSRLLTIEGIAQRMVKMIRAVQPVGPYRISGYSFGGILAYEIATQLIGADQEVEFLALLDLQVSGKQADYPIVMSDTVNNRDSRTEFLDLMSFHVTVSGMDDSTQRSVNDLRLSSLTLEELYNHCKDKGWLPDSWADSTYATICRILARMVEMKKTVYFYSLLPIDVHLFIAQGESSDSDSTERFNAHVPGIRLRAIPIPGTHRTMLKSPQVQVLGRLLSESIREATGKRPVSVPTVRTLVPLTAARSPMRHKQTPLFCVPGSAARVSCFAHLISSLRTSRPIFGFQERGLDGLEVPNYTVEAAARFHLRDLEYVYPSGPLHLLGHLQGGWVAFEMALMLIASGREVKSLTLLDSAPPVDEKSDQLREYMMDDVIAQCLAIVECLTGRLPVNTADLRMGTPARQRQILHRLLVDCGILPDNAGIGDLYGFIRSLGIGLRTTYTPSRVYPNTVRLIVASERTGLWERMESGSANTGWHRWTSCVDEHRLPANSVTLLRPPYAQILAEMLEDEFSQRTN